MHLWMKKNILSMYKDSIENNENFWNQQGGRINWKKKYSKTKNIKYSSKDVSIKWYYGWNIKCFRKLHR